MASQTELLTQINELQDAVVEMKSSLTEAVTRLSDVAVDPTLTKEVQETRQNCDTNTAEVLKLVLSLRTDMSNLQKEVTNFTQKQTSLQETLTHVLQNQQILLSDLSQSGVISVNTRTRLESPLDGEGLNPDSSPPRSGSGSHSNDSGVAMLMERAHRAFHAEQTPSPTLTNNNRTSDQGSLPDTPALLVPSSVYDYVAGLRTHSADSHNPPVFAEDQPMPKEPSKHTKGRTDSEDYSLSYDSDSSITIAANKTISLTTSLSQQCGLELQEPIYKKNHKNNYGRADSDSSERSRKGGLRSRTHKRDTEENPYEIVVMTRCRSSHGDARESQRYRVAKEILDTEKKYCKTLWTIQDTFAEPLKKSRLLSSRDITTLFPDEVYQLYDKHCHLQHQLRERLTSWKWQPMVGDILARFTDPRHTDVLRLYTAYVNDFPEVLKTFHKLCRTSGTFTKFIKTCLEQPACGGLDLGAFLLTPVQRVPRYILLIKQLLKYTEPSHPDYQHLHASLERLRDFLSRLNDSMEHSFQLVHAQLSLQCQEAENSQCKSSQCHNGPTSLPVDVEYVRSTRCSDSSPGSTPITPTTPTSRDFKDQCISGHSPQRSPTLTHRSPSSSNLNTTPRSLSIATGSKTRTRAEKFADNRSSSLPRDVAQNGAKSRIAVAVAVPTQRPGELISQARVRSRSEGVAARRPIARALKKQQTSTSSDEPRTLALARSVTDITVTSAGECGRWPDLGASEPSLIDPVIAGDHSARGNLIVRPLTGAQSVYNLHQKAMSPVWTEGNSGLEDLQNKKKPSIRSSIKSMFTFKKRVSRGYNVQPQRFPLFEPNQPVRVGGRVNAEGDYWDSTQSEGTPGSAAPLTIVGDFMDEDGNPCSNV